MEAKGFVKKSVKAVKNVIKQILQRVRNERDTQVDNNALLEQENSDLECKVKEFENTLLIKIKSLEAAGSKIEIRR